MKIWYKACPRCSGDMIEERYLNEHYAQCLQCGNYMDVYPSEEVQLPLVRNRGRKALEV